MTLMLDPANVEALVYKATTLTELSPPMSRPWRFLNRILKVGPDLLEAIMGKGFALMGFRKGGRGLAAPGLAARLKSWSDPIK